MLLALALSCLKSSARALLVQVGLEARDISEAGENFLKEPKRERGRFDKDRDLKKTKHITVHSVLCLTNQIMGGLHVHLGFIPKSMLVVDESPGSRLQLASSRRLFQLSTERNRSMTGAGGKQKELHSSSPSLLLGLLVAATLPPVVSDAAD